MPCMMSIFTVMMVNKKTATKFTNRHRGYAHLILC